MITLTDDDDPRFIALAGQLLDSAISGHPPAEIYVVRIHGWFDAKWLNFSGKALGALSVWRSPITVPPFHPHRVVAQGHFSAAVDSGAYLPTSAPPLHIAQPSERNLTRSIAKVAPSAIFFWCSAGTLNLDRGSAMLYRTDEGEVFSWYASFKRSPTWRLDWHRGITPNEIQRRLQSA